MQLVEVISGFMRRPGRYDGTVFNFVMDFTAPLATRYQVWETVLILKSARKTRGTSSPLEPQLFPEARKGKAIGKGTIKLMLMHLRRLSALIEY